MEINIINSWGFFFFVPLIQKSLAKVHYNPDYNECRALASKKSCLVNCGNISSHSLDYGYPLKLEFIC